MQHTVTIPRERQQYLVDFFQKLDRMMTGLPIKVIIKNLDKVNNTKTKEAMTDGKRIWLDWSILTRELTTGARLGVNYSQVAHCIYGDPRFDRDIDATRGAANILLDCRDESLFATMYPSVAPFYIATVQELLIKGRPLRDCHDIWPLLYGRKFLPQPARFVCLPLNEDPETIKNITNLIDEFVSLAPERVNVPAMLAITKEFDTLLKTLKVPVVDPGGGKLIRGAKHIDTDSAQLVRRLNITIDRDRLFLKNKFRVVKGPRRYAFGSGAGCDGLQRDVDTDDVAYEITKVVLNAGKKVKFTSTKPPTSKAYETYGDTVTVDGSSQPREDNNFKTQADSAHSNVGGSGNGGGSGGAPLVASELVEDGEIQYTRYVWVDKALGDSWAHGSARLNSYKDAITTSDVRDLIMSLEAEVLFDTDQLKKAGWGGCGAVTSNIRVIRNGFEKELKLASKTLKSQYAAGRRGNICMKAAMRADRLPSANIFTSSTKHLDNNDLDLELVMLVDASGSMESFIQQAMKAQWIIGSAFERRGAKVTIIPFNNVARDPLKGRDDTFSDKIFPFCEANGGTQPHGALAAARDIFDNAGGRFKMLFLLTDGEWNSSSAAYKIIDDLNYNGVFTTMVFLGGDGNAYANVMKNRYHHCSEGFRINTISDLIPQMRKTFFKAFNASIIRTLRRYY